MKLPLDVRCLECGQIFCCANCRLKHEQTKHEMQFDCRLCRFHTLTLDTDKMSDLLIDHITDHHLPLGCKKCGKQYSTKEDFQSRDYLCCKDLVKQNEEHAAEEVSTSEPLQVTPKNSIMNTESVTPPIDAKTFEYLKIKLKSKAEVMTSTPTHPSMTSKQWSIFQKSFPSSSLSGITSPSNSEVVQSPPTEDQKSKEINSPSEIISAIHSPQNFPDRVSKDVSKADVDCIADRSGRRDNPEYAEEPSSASCSKTPQDSSASRKKSVTFADQVLAPKRKTAFEFMRPKRTCTPAKLRHSHFRTPRFQAIINNFEAKSNRTPKQTRFVNPDETPTTDVNTNLITGRTIQFKQESPNIDPHETSPVTSQERLILKSENERRTNVPTTNVPIKPFAVLSPVEKDINTTDFDCYKSCIESPEISPSLSKNQILPQLIAKQIQETLNSAMSSQDFTTEIQLSIKITKKTVSVNEKKKLLEQAKDVDTEIDKNRDAEKQTTTIWSRLVSGLKWVVWGEDARWNYSPKGLEKTDDTTNCIEGSAKRKRVGSFLYRESPVSKRYRSMGRIYGRRPLDRVLRGGVVLPERCQSTDAANLKEFIENAEDNDVMNRSF